MGDRFKHIVIVGREDDPRVADATQSLRSHLTKLGVNLLASDDSAQADLIVSVGGDGTMLYASRIARDSGTPLLGINRGRLGFLADVTPDEMLDSIDRVLGGDFTTDSRLLLEATLTGRDREPVSSYALNDVVLQRRETGRMVDFETRVDGVYVNTHSGDGLIVATPTGSTAYALSCGGPIIEPGLDAVVVVPVCPHTLTDRPIVMPASQAIEVRMLHRDGTHAEITVDGYSMGDLEPDEKLIISAANKRVTLVHPPGYDFYSILRSKLFWGRDNRRRQDPTTC